MKKGIRLAVVLMLVTSAVFGQKYFTKEGKITFTSETPLEKIEAVNNSTVSIWDLESGRMEFAALIKAFQFEKALMQEHFNENYMESDKFPKATFKGQIANIKEVDLSKDGTYDVIVKGPLTIHGETKEIETNGKIIVTGGVPSSEASFPLTVADYGIEIPGVVRDNIAKEVQVVVRCEYKPYKK